jgi:hypothetical protein
MSAELVRDVTHNELPLCPRYGGPGPGSVEHRTAVVVLDTIYDTAARDDDNEFVSPDVAAAYAAANQRVSPRMPLYRVLVSLPRPLGAYVESYYFRCLVCGFTLPAVERATTR